MSSGFVSAGTNEQPIERDDEWLQAQQELEAERRRKAEIGKQKEGKSLFEVLEQNKMAKQEAFEEKSRLRNQFRSLDDDEVEFLDSVLESTRAKEAALKKESAEQLEAFRRRRAQVDKALLERTSSELLPTDKETQAWSVPRKRRRAKENPLFPKKRKYSGTNPGIHTDKEGDSTKKDHHSSTASQGPTPPKSTGTTLQTGTVKNTEKQPITNPAPKPLISLGLGNYDSDSDSD